MPLASRLNVPWVRGVLVLTVAAVAMGALAITPAGSAVDGLSKKEKKQGDNRWINVGEKATDADRLDGQESNAFLKTTGKASDADLLDGQDSAAFLKTTGKAADADKLDGLDSKELSPVSGDGRTADLALTVNPQTVLSTTITTSGSAALLASAALSVGFQGGGTGDVFCVLRFDGTISSVQYSSDHLAVGEEDTLPVVWAQPVGPGAHTVELRCHGGGSLTVDNAGLIVSAHL